jgi:hypothetical protein
MWGRYRPSQNSREDLGAPPKPAAALLPVSTFGLGLPRPYAVLRRVQAASRSNATSSPSWRKNKKMHLAVRIEIIFVMFNKTDFYSYQL